MNLTRRDLAAAGVFALSATALILPAMAATDDEEAVKQAVEALRGRPPRRQGQIHQRDHDAKGCHQVA